MKQAVNYCQRQRKTKHEIKKEIISVFNEYSDELSNEIKNREKEDEVLFDVNKILTQKFKLDPVAV